MSGGFSGRLVKWRCPVEDCNACSRGWIIRYKARISYRRHMRDFHPDVDVDSMEPILEFEDGQVSTRLPTRLKSEASV